MTIDEHSGEAGFNTRLEAFTDMLHWRRCNEDNIPTLGNTYIVVKSILDDLNVEYVIPPSITKSIELYQIFS